MKEQQEKLYMLIFKSCFFSFSNLATAFRSCTLVHNTT